MNTEQNDKTASSKESGEKELIEKGLTKRNSDSSEPATPPPPPPKKKSD